MRLFDRICIVTIYRPDGKALDNPVGFVDKDTDFKETLANGLEIRNLDVSFQIDKSISKDPNTAEITIYNLSETTRSILNKTRPLTVRIDAGHDGVARHLATGNVKYGDSKIEDTSVETTIELADGGRAFSHAQVNKSYSSGTPLKTILREAASSMGLKLPSELNSAAVLNSRIPRGMTLDGLARDELTRLLAPLGYGWSIQNGQLQVLADSQVRNDSARLVSESTGLIGSPGYGHPDKKGKRKLSFECLLYPELIPGGRIILNSKYISGQFKLLKVSHKGDTRGDDWTTECEAVPL